MSIVDNVSVHIYLFVDNRFCIQGASLKRRFISESVTFPRYVPDSVRLALSAA